MRWAIRRRLTSRSMLQFGVVAIPLLTYAVAVLGHGNGLVAAFVAGVAFHAVRGDLAHAELELCEGLTQLATSVVWFTLGAVTVTVLLGSLHGIGLPTLVGWYARHAPPEPADEETAGT